MQYPTQPSSPPFPVRSVARIVAVMWVTGAFLGSQSAWAAEVEVNGQTKTSVGTASNGSTVISIANRNAAGVSYNGFNKFNATNANGTFFDNQTVLAKTIIGEVTGKEASVLSQKLGVLGQKSDLVLINPNGITVNGSVAFSNVEQATLVVGAGNKSASGELISFDTSRAAAGASLIVNGALSNPQGALALLSPVINVAKLASLRAHSGYKLSVTTGRGTFDARSTRLLAIDPSASTSVSVDASLLGAMTAGVINVVSTRQGAGVNVGDATLTSQGDITIDSKGAIAGKSGAMNATGNVVLSSGSDLNLEGYSVAATQNISLSAANQVYVGVVESRKVVEAPVVSNEYSDIRVSGDFGFGLFRPLGVNVSGNASLGANYTSDRSESTTQTVSSLKAGQDVSVQAGATTTLVGTIVNAGGNATVQGAQGVTLAAAKDTASRNTMQLHVNGGGKVSGVVPYIFGQGTVRLNGNVTGTVEATQTSSSIAKAVSITAAKNVDVKSAQGDVLTQGVAIKAGSIATVTAGGNVITSVATSTNSSLTEKADLRGTVSVPIVVDNGLRILGNVFTGGNLINNIHLDTINVAGSASGGINGTTTTTQNGGSITGAQAVNVLAANQVRTSGTAFTAPIVVVSGDKGVVLGAATTTVATLAVSGGGTLAEQNFLSGKLKIRVDGGLNSNVSIQGKGTQIQASQINVSSTQGKVELNGARLSGNGIDINGVKGVDVGTSLDMTAQVAAKFNGQIDLTTTGMSLQMSQPTLNLGGGSVGVTIPKIDLALNAVIDMAVAGSAQGNLSIGGNGSQLTSKQDVNIASSEGGVKVTGSTIASTGSTTIQSAQGLDIASSLRMSAAFDSQFNVGANALTSLSVSIHDLSIATTPGTLALKGIGLSTGLNVGLGGLSVGAGLPQLGLTLNVAASGSATLSSDASTLTTGRDLTLASAGRTSLSKPNIKAGGNVAITGDSVYFTAPYTTKVTGQLAAQLPVQILPDLAVDFSKAGLELGAGIDLAQAGGQLSANGDVTVAAKWGVVSMTGMKINTPGTVKLKAPLAVRLNATMSVGKNGLVFNPTEITAGKAVAYQTLLLGHSTLAKAKVNAPLITLNGWPMK
ncbi:MAG: filamentous hemagglutinin N-terminal domain-containing protein [Aquabacterium sp.]|nr:filamentous hemagglutinin N-terminal domain-containing protein [Aquabacterium sp.]